MTEAYLCNAPFSGDRRSLELGKITTVVYPQELGHEAPRMKIRSIKARSLRSHKRYPRTRSQRQTYLAWALLAATLPGAIAESCISLSRSTQCPAFNSSSISTDTSLTNIFPFLSSVTDVASFDQGIQQYIAQNFTVQRYQELIGCSTVDLSNTTDYYARYTTSVLCNAIVQNSINPCGLSGVAKTPLCADSCAQYSSSEETISQSSLCGTAGPNAQSQIRADFTNCALPADSLSGSCIEGAANEPDNCGYSSNLSGLCSYCAASSPNATDSCCLGSKTETRCSGVVLPIALASSTSSPSTSSMSSTTTNSATSSASSLVGNPVHSKGLTGGQIAGIVVGSILGAFLLLALLILGCILLRRRQKPSPASSIFNQPGQSRQGPTPMAMHDGAASARIDNVQALPGGRIARMAAIEGLDDNHDRFDAVGVGKYAISSSEEDSPESRRGYGFAAPPKRSGSLTSGSVLAISATDESSPEDTFSSPEGTGQSERLNFFKDYYSQDEIKPGDLVSTLWAYQPRAEDEFELERGDMLKVVGIWDDGWGTGVRVRLKAEDWREGMETQRDSGMSNGGSRHSSPASPGADSDVKAFPLVCICLPQHWHKTIEGDSTEDSGGMQLPHSP